MNPCKEIIHERFKYIDGLPGLYLKVKQRGKIIGDRSGYIHSRGYRHTSFDGNVYKEHILVWIYHYGHIPDNMIIDHKDGIRDNNVIDNLRLSNGFENQRNRGANKNNSTGYKGVVFANSKFAAQIMANNKSVYLGRFKTKEEAALAYNKASIELHGDFAYQNTI